MRWTVHPDWRERLLGPDGLRLDDWLRTGQVQIVKHGPHRTVYRVAVDGVTIYIKHNRLWNVRAWLRELIRPAKARIEYERAQRDRGPRHRYLRAAGGRRDGRPAAGRKLPDHARAGATPSSSTRSSRRCCRPSKRGGKLGCGRRLARALADFVRRLHDQGIHHHDFHPGNLLLRLEGDDAPRLFLVDLHATHVGRPLTESARLANLVVLNNWFAFRASRGDRLRFWMRLSGCWPRRPGHRAGAAFVPDPASLLERPGLAVRHQQSLLPPHPPALLPRLCRERSGPRRAGTLARRPGCAVSLARRPVAQGFAQLHGRRAGAAGGRHAAAHDLQALRGDGLARTLASAVAATPAWRSWTQGHGLLVRGLPTPRPGPSSSAAATACPPRVTCSLKKSSEPPTCITSSSPWKIGRRRNGRPS